MARLHWTHQSSKTSKNEDNLLAKHLGNIWVLDMWTYSISQKKQSVSGGARSGDSVWGSSKSEFTSTWGPWIFHLVSEFLMRRNYLWITTESMGLWRAREPQKSSYHLASTTPYHILLTSSLSLVFMFKTFFQVLQYCLQVIPCFHHPGHF